MLCSHPQSHMHETFSVASNCHDFISTSIHFQAAVENEGIQIALAADRSQVLSQCAAGSSLQSAGPQFAPAPSQSSRQAEKVHAVCMIICAPEVGWNKVHGSYLAARKD